MMLSTADTDTYHLLCVILVICQPGFGNGRTNDSCPARMHVSLLKNALFLFPRSNLRHFVFHFFKWAEVISLFFAWSHPTPNTICLSKNAYPVNLSLYVHANLVLTIIVKLLQQAIILVPRILRKPHIHTLQNLESPDSTFSVTDKRCSFSRSSLVEHPRYTQNTKSLATFFFRIFDLPLIYQSIMNIPLAQPRRAEPSHESFTSWSCQTSTPSSLTWLSHTRFSLLARSSRLPTKGRGPFPHNATWAAAIAKLTEAKDAPKIG